MKTVNDIPGLKEILDECQDKVTDLIGYPVFIHFSMKVQHISTQQLTAIICEVCEIPWRVVVSNSRRIGAVIARHLYCYFAYTVQKKPLVFIADLLNRDHTTIMYARDKIKNMIDSKDDLYMPLLEEIEKRINQIMLPEAAQDIEFTNDEVKA